MPLTDVVALDAIIPALKVNGKKQALQELAAKAAQISGHSEKTIFETLMQREKLGSTGVGNGVAIPHGKLPKLDKLFGLFARLERPVDFESLDGQPVESRSSCCWRRKAPAPITSRRWPGSRGCCVTPTSRASCASRAMPRRSTQCWRCRRPARA